MGKFHRIVSNDQEAIIVDYINQNYIKPEYYFSNSMVQTLIFDAYDEVYADQIVHQRFNSSIPGFINDFKSRNNISSRIVYFGQKPININEEDLNIKIESFKKQIPFSKVNGIKIIFLLFLIIQQNRK